MSTCCAHTWQHHAVDGVYCELCNDCTGWHWGVRVPRDVLTCFELLCAQNGVALRNAQSGHRGDQTCCIIATPHDPATASAFAQCVRNFAGYEVVWKAAGRTDAL